MLKEKRDKTRGEIRIFHKKELRDLYRSPNIVRKVNSK
jgi:hypothetical protein